MNTKTTHDVRVSVESFYQPEHSRPGQKYFVFAYRITIENLGQFKVQLLSRHWRIVDSSGERREVKGEGVIGEQPILEPGASFQYVSWCELSTDMGFMWGNYTFLDHSEDNDFEVAIPVFNLVAPYRYN
jgi:ApaG protein